MRIDIQNVSLPNFTEFDQVLTKLQTILCLKPWQFYIFSPNPIGDSTSLVVYSLPLPQRTFDQPEMFEGLLLPWQQIDHLAFFKIQFLGQLLKFLLSFTLLK